MVDSSIYGKKLLAYRERMPKDEASLLSDNDLATLPKVLYDAEDFLALLHDYVCVVLDIRLLGVKLSHTKLGELQGLLASDLDIEQFRDEVEMLLNCNS